jgi:hypothetical protein
MASLYIRNLSGEPKIVLDRLPSRVESDVRAKNYFSVDQGLQVPALQSLVGATKAER